MPQDLLERGKFDVVVVVNPNNPDGRLLPTASLRLLAEAQAERGGWLVVDEAFADVLSVPDGMGMAGAAGTSTGGVPGLLVMRSFGKFFGLAGVRLGYLLTTPALARQIHRALGPWAVAGPALAIATEALRDRSWIEATRSKLSAAAAALDQVLRAGGLEVIGGTSLFRLTRTPSPAARLYSALAAAGILVRRFDHHKSWLRFGLPGDEAAICRLERVLQKECLR
jgi:cobalamin biosynthetic protein CobC